MGGKILLALICLLPAYGFGQQKNWQNLDLQRDSVFGISTEKAYTELLKGKTPQPVIVAVIDGGVDSTQEDLKEVLWHNPKANSSDDGNFGWSFVCSGKEEIYIDNNEETVVVRDFERGDTTLLSSSDLATYHKAKQRLQDELMETRSSIGTIEKKVDSLFETSTREVSALEQQDTTRLGDSSLAIYHTKKEDLRLLTQAQRWKTLGGKSLDSLFGIYFRRATAPGMSKVRLVCSFYFKDLYGLACLYNMAYDPHSQDQQGHYGCPDATGPDPHHGTFVAGIIGAVRNNGLGIDGVADDVRIMSLRVVPVAGHVRMKDLASAIRYAADHGARVINISIGSSEFGSDKKAIDKAVKFAMKKDVLIVQAAGNIHIDMDTAGFFMYRNYQDGRQAGAYIVVGGSGPRNDSTLCRDYTIGKKSVDVFAPSDDITSTMPGNKYLAKSGTSMASPVVAGLAALIREYYPKLKAQQVKDIILQSVVKSNYLTGKCVSGGVVNAYNALQLAAKQEDVN